MENAGNMRYLLKLKIGSKKQEFKVQVDTGSSILWVFGMECEDSVAKCAGHTKFKASDSDTYKKVDDHFEIFYAIGEIKGITAKDTVYFSDTLEAESQEFGTASSVDIQFPGINMMKEMGNRPVITAMKEAVMDPILSLFLKGGGSAADGGEITFGGVNEAHFDKGTKLKVDVIGAEKFLLQMDEVKLGDTEMCTKDGKVYCEVSIDSGCSLIVGPKALIDAFHKDELKGTGAGMSEDEMTEMCRCCQFPRYEYIVGRNNTKIESKYYTQKFGPKCYSKLYGRDDPVNK